MLSNSKFCQGTCVTLLKIPKLVWTHLFTSPSGCLCALLREPDFTPRIINLIRYVRSLHPKLSIYLFKLGCTVFVCIGPGTNTSLFYFLGALHWFRSTRRARRSVEERLNPKIQNKFKSSICVSLPDFRRQDLNRIHSVQSVPVERKHITR